MIDGLLSLILFGIELILLIIICVKNRDHPQFWIIFTIMLLLQTYQLTEFLLCIGITQNFVVRLALSIITFLPPTGYLLTIRVLQCKRKFMLLIFYLSLLFGIIITFYFFFVDTTIKFSTNLWSQFVMFTSSFFSIQPFTYPLLF